jgi:hypothetical protein
MTIEDVRRFIWFSTEDKTFFGKAFRKELETRNWLQKLFGRKYVAGTYYQMDKVSLVQALEAFDSFLSSPYSFSIETKEGCRIDLFYKKGAKELFLETWFSDENIEDTTIPVNGAKELLEIIFKNDSDKTIAQYINVGETLTNN